MKRISTIKLSLLTILLFALESFGQSEIGTFTSHPALHSFHSVACDGNTVYAAAPNAIMLLDISSSQQSDQDITFLSKVEGLSDIDINKIFYFKGSKTLMVAYDNGNLDFIRNDKLTNIQDIKDKSITSSKSLVICREIDDKAYLVYPFGVVVIDMEQLVISDTWFTKRENKQYQPTDVARDSQRWYISTEDGVFSAPAFSTILADFSKWQPETAFGVSFLSCVKDKVFASKHTPGTQGNDSIFIREDGHWSGTTKSYSLIRNISSENDTLLVCNWNHIELLDSNLDRLFLASWQESSGYPDAREAVLYGDNIWVADNAYGLVQNNMTYYYHKNYIKHSPFTDYVERMLYHNGTVAAVHGSRKGSSAFAPGYNFPALSVLNNGQWSYNATDFIGFDTLQMTFDLTDVAVNPRNESEMYVASWGNGLFKCKDNRAVAHYNARNSPLDSTQYGQTFVSGLKFDRNGNLWMTNSQSSKMLKVLTPDGEWYSYNIGSGVVVSTTEGVVAENLLIDSHGYKWVNFPRDGTVNRYSLIAFSDNGTLDNFGDDKLARIDMNIAAEVSSSRVFCMAEDHDGEIWIGTDKGVKVIYYPSRVFSSSSHPRNILLEQDGYVSVLLEYEDVTAIAVDGANRKWIGTGRAGVFLMSENGQEELLHFTAEDHPLFSNQIVAITVNELTGEVFFATAKGLISYKGTATTGSETYQDLLVYPNPVPHGYSGVIAVKGLKTNSLCKITDSQGRLVWQGYSDGGQLVWNGKDHFGNRPASGVYYVMASDEDGKEKILTKFVFIN